MQAFIFRFDGLLRYRRNRRDLCRQLLAQAMEAQREAAEQRSALESSREAVLSEMRNLGQLKRISIDEMAVRRYYAGRLTVEWGLLARREHLIAQQITQCRQALMQADRDVKILEKLEERQREDHRYQQERRDALELEEAWRNTALARAIRRDTD